MTTSFRIRRGIPADAGALAALASRTFEETFRHTTTAEDMAAYLARAYGVAQQGAELADRDTVTFLVEVDGVLAAFAQVRRGEPGEPLDLEAPVELYRFYVDRPWHGQGLAQHLMQRVRAAARELGGRDLWLSVWSGNERAKAFYAKEGFVDRAETVFWLGSDRQVDRIFVAALASGAE
ncbi:MAG: GNAT family N-acetyltransferase [Gemmatimonadetes bacterium]|nr:GNAT family N-acetyltransferase [Gemmatimonadota bacterium]